MESINRSMSTASIIAHLSDWDPRDRHQAREILVNQGDVVLPLLIEKLTDRDWHVRWEAAKALGELGNPAAVEPLVLRLMDDDTSVRWAAMGSLITFGRASVKPMMLELTQNFHSARLRQAIHHVLHALLNRGALLGIEIAVYRALEGAHSGIDAARLANQVLLSEYNPPNQKPQ